MEGAPRRKPTRLTGYDYSSYGGYFVTICSHEKRCLFGKVLNDAVVLSALGRLVNEHWLAIPRHYPHISLDQYIVMPNHLHGILMIVQETGGSSASPTHGMQASVQGGSSIKSRMQPITRVIGDFKSGVTREFRKSNPTWQGQIWQRGFYDRVIRDERDLHEIREYIVFNPLKWELDRENPNSQRKSPNQP